jgi:hypothetical protein
VYNFIYSSFQITQRVTPRPVFLVVSANLHCDASPSSNLAAAAAALRVCDLGDGCHAERVPLPQRLSARASPSWKCIVRLPRTRRATSLGVRPGRARPTVYYDSRKTTAAEGGA